MAEEARELVVISRYWKEAQISLRVDNEQIKLSIPLQQFIEALCTEAGSVTFTVTEDAFRKQMRKACESVIAKVKEESVRIM